MSKAAAPGPHKRGDRNILGAGPGAGAANKAYRQECQGSDVKA
jgi:hypothetical protein